MIGDRRWRAASCRLSVGVFVAGLVAVINTYAAIQGDGLVSRRGNLVSAAGCLALALLYGVMIWRWNRGR